MKQEVQHVFMVGAKSLGAYGGFETFVNKLTEYHALNTQIKYHVACKANGDGFMDESKLEGAAVISDEEFLYHNAHCFKIKVPQIGAAQAIIYDLLAIKWSLQYIQKHKIKSPIIYIMACRIGPFIPFYYKKIHQMGGRVYINPDGHEWKRAKWTAPVRKYWKCSEQNMIKYSDLVICDSLSIEKYIHASYDHKGIQGRSPSTVYIAYGAEIEGQGTECDAKLEDWYKKTGLSEKEYYLIVGRFVPENNYEIMIREFMKSHSSKKLAIITNVNQKFLLELERRIQFSDDERIQFVGTVYDQALLEQVRKNAYAYLHGHEVGGTNPSLLEALGATELNLLLDVGFNREVAEDAALYWKKTRGNLAQLIDKVDQMPDNVIVEYGKKAKARVRKAFSWEFIAAEYEKVFVPKS